MACLLDSHVLLWWLEDSPTLEEKTKDMIDTDPNIFVSAVTAWELMIKHNSGKLETDVDAATLMSRSEFDELPITFDHALTAGALPIHHKDPFDRMLVAQAQREGLTLVTHDSKIQRYDVDVLAV